ncbi:MAG: hypothetical protein ACU0B9_19465 [Limimaricola soesokkakensis]|uniref:hypothetical protein n=1 Tax=Limimaricola soesokkakensis TaxID=1343159 RepID=UPI004058A84C
MSSKRASYLLRKTIWTPKTPDDDPFLPGAPATLHAKAEVTLSEAGGLPHGQPKAVISLAMPADDDLSGPAARALVREEVIRVLRAMAEAMEASRDSSQEACEPHDRVSQTAAED